MSGSWSLLPLGIKVIKKIENIIREEMNAIGGQEMLLPVVHPAEPWKKSGRWDDVEGILVKLKDRRDADLLLAMTHEEIFTTIATELTSYRELPQLWYHFQTKFRDEPRPKGGLLRVREFTMKDSYTFDIDPDGLDAQFRRHYDAYRNIFRRLGMAAIPVHASSGWMGGSESVEFMVEGEAGEDDTVVCPAGDYAANVEKATSKLPGVSDEPWEGSPERFPTPGIRTIAALAEHSEFASADRQIKSLVYFVDGEPVMFLLRGDHELMEQKIIDGLATWDVRPAQDEEIHALVGAHAGSLGAVGVEGLRVVADPALKGRFNMVTGANEDDWHLRGVDVERDIVVDSWLDIRTVSSGEGCPVCGEALEIKRTIEVGHIFKLGTKFSEALGARVLDEEGVERVIWMGSYGIGLGRNMAAVVEAHHDEKGIVWPVATAPYEVVVTAVSAEDAPTVEASEMIYQGLIDAGVDAILDDRDERPGVKFADSELIGFPYRITVGPRGLADGLVEVLERRTGEVEKVPVGEAVGRLSARVESERLPGPEPE
jgi:prolyl-tRNA synthetase